ncbi:MAG: hypothetical protein M1838_004264 [Thelocarpon superellum]|nr:MAG: hypothetical protein M1838_004264 [Thelocarpon superellum]
MSEPLPPFLAPGTLPPAVPAALADFDGIYGPLPIVPPSSSALGPSQAPPAPPTPTGPPPPPNPRSCILCRRRKVKCDKCSPCSNCAKANLVCTFPSPGRAPRRSRKPSEGELLSRLRKLEGVVKELRRGEKAAGIDHEDDKERLDDSRSVASAPARANEDRGPLSLSRPAETGSLEKGIGRLVVDEGRSRYVSSVFWSSLTDEMDDLTSMLDDVSEDDAEDMSPDSGHLSNLQDHQGFFFGFSSLLLDFRQLHPTPERIVLLWGVYRRTVDPMIKVLHRPAAEKLIMEGRKNVGDLSKTTEVLMFAIYFAAVTSLSPQECEEMLGEDQPTLVARYRFGTEQALARADFLNTHEVAVLQALVLFLNCVRRHDETRFVWSMVGLAIRMAQSLGLHRDGTAFDLTPFEIEMRRRLWWHICVLDVRASEDHGSDPTITEHLYDTQLPLNINDDDMRPDSMEPITPRVGSTEMTFCLVRFVVCRTSRKFYVIPPGPLTNCPEMFSKVPREVKERWIEECNASLEEEHLQYLDMCDPLSWVSATVARLIMARMWLMLYHPFRREAGEPSLSPDTQDRLFVTSIEVIEYARLLEVERTTAQWGWLFRRYVQWHAIAFILAELCHRTQGANVDRAWAAVDGVFDQWGEQVTNAQRAVLWRPMRKLMHRAKRARELALAHPSSSSHADSTRTNTPTSRLLGPMGASSSAVGGAPMSNTAHVPPGQIPGFAPYIPPTASTVPTANGPLGAQDAVDQWMVSGAGASNETPGFGDGPEDWANWDRLVSDFQMDGSEPKGTVVGEFGSGWW